MDHAINALKTFLEVSLDCIADELKSGNYAKLSDCPSYSEAKALISSIHSMEKYYYGEAKTSSIRDEMKWRGVLKWRNF